MSDFEAKKVSKIVKIWQNGSKMSLFEHSWSSKGSKISQNVSKIDLFEHFWSPWAPQNSSFSVCFQVGKPIFLRVGCDFYSKSHEISRKTRGFSLFETGETLYFTCPNAVFLVFFSADSSKNTFFTQKVALKLELLVKSAENYYKKWAFRRYRTGNPS